MNFFDLHCDTIGECYLQNKCLRKNNLHISLERGAYLDKWSQVFAIWIPDEKRGSSATAYFNGVYRLFKRETEENGDVVLFCKSGADIEKAAQQGKTAAILAVEGGAAAAGEISGIDYLYDCGVRLMTLTWNGSNEIASGCFSEDKSGLTAFGRRVVGRMQEIGMIVDVSHLNERGFYDVAQITDKPFVASHSNSAAVFPHKRNLTDAQIDIMIERKCLIGLNLYTEFLGEGEKSGCDKALRHAYHILERGGERVLAIGSDYDGCMVADEIAGIEKISVLASYFERHGINGRCVEDIFFNNAHFFVSDILQKP